VAHLRLLLDTNVVIDYLSKREPHYAPARLLMIAGRVREFELWITSSQFTELIYILSNGGKAAEIPQVLEQLRGLRTFVEVFPVSGREIDIMLASSWKDPEDCLLYESALALGADAIITRDRDDFPADPIPVCDCDEFFAQLEEQNGLSYAELLQ
jgi:predicted nucleic acid-binding protein